MFHIFRGLCKGLFPSFICRMNFSLMKQSVAPESTSAFMSAIALLVLIEMGICMDRNRIVTITELNLWTALTQADGFRRFENPLFQQGPSSPILVRLLLPTLLLGAMSWLVVAEFERLIVPPRMVLRRRHFGRLLWPRVLDSDADSSCVIRWVCSTYAEGNCDSNAPFCDRCNTQLRVGPLSFLLLLVLFAYILLAEYILHGAWLRGSSPRFLPRVLLSVLPTYPWHLDQLSCVGVST